MRIDDLMKEMDCLNEIVSKIKRTVKEIANLNLVLNDWKFLFTIDEMIVQIVLSNNRYQVTDLMGNVLSKTTFPSAAFSHLNSNLDSIYGHIIDMPQIETKFKSIQTKEDLETLLSKIDIYNKELRALLENYMEILKLKTEEFEEELSA